MKQYLVKTWACTNLECPYKWQFEGEAANSQPQDLTAEQLHEQFPQDAFIGLMPGKCPSCYIKGISSDLYYDLAGQSSVFIADDEDIENETVDDTDHNGNVITEVVDVKKVIGIVNGRVEAVDQEIKEAKKRPLNKQEKIERKADQNKARASIEKIGIKEV